MYTGRGYGDNRYFADNPQAGFLKSSPKITLYPKVLRRSVIPNNAQFAFSDSQVLSNYGSRNSSPAPPGSGPSHATLHRSSSPSTKSVTWICTICSQSNQLPPYFDVSTANAYTQLSPCAMCGVKPALAHVLKAAVSNASGRHPAISNQALTQQLKESHQQDRDATGAPASMLSTNGMLGSRFQCPRCTFLNHPCLPDCELCGASLTFTQSSQQDLVSTVRRPESPGPILRDSAFDIDHSTECVKFSFHAGGEKVFHERLKGAMQQRKWLLHNAPPIPKPDHLVGETSGSSGQIGRPTSDRMKSVGIAGLERRGKELRRNNEIVIGDAFEDLETLMASAKEIIALADSFANKSVDGSSEASAILQESATALGMVTTKAMLGSNASSETLYLSELSRNLAEYLTDDSKGVLRQEGGIMSLVDLWAVFNRARGGFELISPLDFAKAAHLWEKLGLPVRLRGFKNGLLVVQRHDRTDDNTISQLLAWLQELHVNPPLGDMHWDWEAFGRGVTAHEVGQKFGWSIGVATEELGMAEERGMLCREEGVEGVRFWENFIGQEEPRRTADKDAHAVAQNLERIGLL